jgi:CelD/BcsL family acetyltransferase involved in cellulose biosynthesis
MMSQMMDQMGGEMRQMKMTESREWSALTDSVRQDLAELPSLKGRALSTRMRAHAGRVQRLITAHQGMMKGMR